LLTETTGKYVLPLKTHYPDSINSIIFSYSLMLCGGCKHISGEIVSVFAWSVEDRVVRQVKTIDYKICMAASPLSTQH
jgi:hypothetical protein